MLIISKNAFDAVKEVHRSAALVIDSFYNY